jgi:hypothetical protein
MNNKESNGIKAIIDDITYVPNNREVRMKAAFWAKYQTNPVYQAGDIPALADIVSTLNSSSIEKSWKKDGFKEWFLNSDEFRQKSRYLATRAQEELEGLLAMPVGEGGIKASEKLSAIKLAFDLEGSYQKKQKEVKMLDAAIDKMNPAELESYIAKLEG